jgi:hypothetical protein
MIRMLGSVEASGIEGGNKWRINREGKNKVLCRRNILTGPMTVFHNIFKQGLQK